MTSLTHGAITAAAEKRREGVETACAETEKLDAAEAFIQSLAESAVAANASKSSSDKMGNNGLGARQQANDI